MAKTKAALPEQGYLYENLDTEIQGSETVQVDPEVEYAIRKIAQAASNRVRLGEVLLRLNIALPRGFNQTQKPHRQITAYLKRIDLSLDELRRIIELLDATEDQPQT